MGWDLHDRLKAINLIWLPVSAHLFGLLGMMQYPDWAKQSRRQQLGWRSGLSSFVADRATPVVKVFWQSRLVGSYIRHSLTFISWQSPVSYELIRPKVHHLDLQFVSFFAHHPAN